MALTYNELNSITQKYYVPKLVDNIFNSNVLFNRMKKGNKYRKYTGGMSIMQPVLYATTTASGSYAGTQTLDTTPNDQISSAEWTMKQYYANITISRADELNNSGDAQIINFVKSKVQVAEKTLADKLGTALYNAGTDALELVGLRAMITTSGTYGGISRTDYSWWQAQVDSTTTSLTVAAMQSLYGDATIGNDKPDLAITTQDQFDVYHGLLQPQERYVDEQSASAGFTNLAFRGIPLLVDAKCPSGYLYFLNEEYFDLYVHKDEDFRFEPFQKPINQNASSAKIYWAGALVCSNCRMQAVMTALT